jgi:hypothetical protein
VGAALAAFRRQNGLCEGEREARWWLVRAGDWALPLPNFAWRRRAIDAHDVHHLLTGYPCTVEGELLIAAWEFGAGRFPHWGATVFCGPLVLAALSTMPKHVRRVAPRPPLPQPLRRAHAHGLARHAAGGRAGAARTAARLSAYSSPLSSMARAM